MDRSTDKSLWDRVCNLFGGRSGDSIEQAVMEARDEGELDLAEGSMILSILRLDDVQVQDIMTPRTDFDCMPTGAPVSEVAQCILETGHSRLPIYKDTRDNIIGIAYAKDLISLLVDPAKHHTAVDEIMRSPFFVPETKIVSELLQEFRSRKNHIAIAVDEYGGTSGLATIEDILEEIVGDINDEYDEQEIVYTRDKNGAYIFEASTLLNDFYKITDIEEDSFQEVEGDADTLAGLILEIKGELPHKDEVITYKEHQFKVLEVDNRRIKKIQYKKTGQLPLSPMTAPKIS